MASRRIEVEIIGSSRNLEAALGRSSASLTGFQKRAQSVGATLTRVGGTLTRDVTLPVVAAGAAATKMAIDFDTALNHVQALTGASAKQTKQWGDEILRLAPKIGQSPQQLAEALYFVASSGAKVNQVLPITIASAKAAASGMGDAQTVAQLLTSAVNAYGSKSLSAARAADVLTEAIKLGKAEPADFATSLGRVIPIAQTMGVTFGEVATSVAELTNTGLSADQAVTAVRATLTGLLKPATQTREELHKLGTSADDVRKSIRERGLNATLDDLAKKIGGNKDALGKLFPNVRALTGFLALTGSNAGNVAGALDKMAHSTGAAGKAFQTASAGPSQTLARDLAQLEVTAIKLGNTLLPVVTRIAGDIGGLASAFSGLSASQQDEILVAVGVAAALGPTLVLIGNIAKVSGYAADAAGALGGAMLKLAGGATAAEGAEAGLLAMNPELLGFVAIAAGITAIGLAVWASQTGSDVDVLAGSFGRAQGAVDGLAGSLRHLRDDHLNLKTALDNQTAAQLASAAAQRVVTKLQKEGKTHTFAYRQAVNEAALAQDRYAAAEQDTTDAANKLGRQEQRNHVVIEGNRKAFQRITAVARAHFQVIHKGSGDIVQNARVLAIQGRRAKENSDVVQHYSDHMRQLAGNMDAAAGKIQKSNPIVADNERKLAGAARAAGLVAQMINAIPSSKDISIYLRTHEIIYGNTRVGAPPATTTGGATPSNNPPPSKPPQRSARGGPVYRGSTYLVGERGPELLHMGGGRGVVTPNSAMGGGGWELTITNWQDGVGYIRHVADGSAAAAAARSARDRRMGR